MDYKYKIDKNNHAIIYNEDGTIAKRVETPTALITGDNGIILTISDAEKLGISLFPGAAILNCGGTPEN